MAACSEEQISPVRGCARCYGQARKLPHGSTSEPIHRVCRHLSKLHTKRARRYVAYWSGKSAETRHEDDNESIGCCGYMRKLQSQLQTTGLGRMLMVASCPHLRARLCANKNGGGIHRKPVRSELHTLSASCLPFCTAFSIGSVAAAMSRLACFRALRSSSRIAGSSPLVTCTQTLCTSTGITT